MNLGNLGILILTFKGAYLTASCCICAYMASELGNSRHVFAWKEGSADTHAAAPEPRSELSSSQILPSSAAPACLLALPPAL